MLGAVLVVADAVLGGEGVAVSSAEAAGSAVEVVLVGRLGLDDSELLQLAARSRKASERAKIRVRLNGRLMAIDTGGGLHSVHSTPRYLWVMGMRRSLPKALLVMRMPGGFWRRLYSAVSTSFEIRVTRRAS